MVLHERWEPSAVTRQQLKYVGLSSAIQTEYFQSYRKQYTGKKIDHPCWDTHLLEWCKTQWSADARNEQATTPGVMRSTWEPSEKTQAQLVSEGMDQQWLAIIAGEFKIYWIDVGTPKTNWNKQFVWWARKQWSKQMAPMQTQVPCAP